MTQNGPCMPTRVPDQTNTRSSHFGHLNVRWISRRWKPTECPVHIVTASSATDTASALKVNNGTASTTVAASMPAFHNDRAGSQVTVPATGSTSAVRIRELTLYGSLATEAPL